MLKMEDFWEHGKPIAVLLGEKLSFLDIFQLSSKFKNAENGRFLEKMASL